MNRPAAFLPMTPAEVAARGWDAVDVVFVTGDAYIDHPSFAMAILGRTLEAAGFRVAILSQPDWHSCAAWQTFGRPRVCFAISAGNLDSMLNRYTAAKKVRNDDAYSPGGKTGCRPDRATAVYCQRAREAYPGVPILAGGVEASLRRLAHYDYWSDKVRRSIILDAKADLLVYGMGETPLVEIVRRLAAGQPLEQLRDLRGIVYRLGANEASRVGQAAACEQQIENSLCPPRDPRGAAANSVGRGDQRSASAPVDPPYGSGDADTVLLPSYEAVSTDKQAFCEMTRLVYRETNPCCARRLVQFHGREAVVVNPPSLPLSQDQMDRVYGLPFTRQPHPSYGKQKIPAFEVIKDSVQIMRGCFGGCTFCSLTAHQGRVIQSRSQESILAEVQQIVAEPEASGVISDLGGPSANMYQMGCSRPALGEKCRRTSCVYPNVCKFLRTDHGPLIALMQAARAQPGVKKVLIASGVRMDLARRDPRYVRELAKHHTGGLLKVAPEHCDADVLRRIHKPSIDAFEEFEQLFHRAADEAGKEQYLVPYFMAGHPGCTLGAMIRLAQFLKRTGYRPDKVQDFIPLPMDIATCMYHTGLDPMTGEDVNVPRGARERRLQRALLQFFKPENYNDVRQALEEAGRMDLIGSGPQCLVPARPPQAIERRRRERPAKPPADERRHTTGYRPFRKTARRRKG